MSGTDPLKPSTVYLDHLEKEIQRRKYVATAETQPSDSLYPGQGQLWERACVAGEAMRDQLRDIAFDLHDHPEEAFEEVYACERLSAVLSEQGFSVESPLGGLGTAFRTSFATPDFQPDVHPRIAILAEYDALPGIGHACGHNIIAAAGVGAFLAAVTALSAPAATPQGCIQLIGTPAEEGHTGKEYLIRSGVFEGVDAAVMVHPFGYDLAEHAWVGRRTLTARFTGVAAHASSQPFMGRNALDAAALAYQGLGLLRQQMPPSDRLHAVISEGGARPSVIPESASMSIYVRSLLPQALADLSERVDDVLRGAALMAGVELETTWDQHPASLPVRNNSVLSSRWTHTQRLRGRHALPAGVVPDSLAASTDFGNVSHLVPGIHPMVKIAPENVALHTAEFARYSRSEAAVDAAVDSAIGLAQVTLDMIADPELLAQARTEFEAQGGVLSVVDYLG